MSNLILYNVRFNHNSYPYHMSFSNYRYARINVSLTYIICVHIICWYLWLNPVWCMNLNQVGFTSLVKFLSANLCWKMFNFYCHHSVGLSITLVIYILDLWTYWIHHRNLTGLFSKRKQSVDLIQVYFLDLQCQWKVKWCHKQSWKQLNVSSPWKTCSVKSELDSGRFEQTMPLHVFNPSIFVEKMV